MPSHVPWSTMSAIVAARTSVAVAMFIKLLIAVVVVVVVVSTFLVDDMTVSDTGRLYRGFKTEVHTIYDDYFRHNRPKPVITVGLN